MTRQAPTNRAALTPIVRRTRTATPPSPWGSSQRLQHELPYVIPGTLDALAKILQYARQNGHQVDFRFEARAGHADGIADSCLLVDEVVEWNGV